MRYASWKIPNKRPEVLSGLLDIGCSPLLASLLSLRGITDPAEANRFYTAVRNC
jgi:hypothetical protein